MATQSTTEYTAQQQRDYNRSVSPSYRALQAPLRIARYEQITITADEADDAGDDILLGNLGCAGTIQPEFCRLVGISGSVSGAFTLEKVNAAGTVTALTGTATISTDDTSVAFTRVSGGVISFDAEDDLQLTLTTDTSVVAGDVIELIIAYTSEEIQ